MERLIRKGANFVAERIDRYNDEFCPVQARTLEDFARIVTETGAKQVWVTTEYHKGQHSETQSPLGGGVYLPPDIITRFSTIGAPVGRRAIYPIHHELAGKSEEMTMRLLVTAYDQRNKLQEQLPEIPVSVHVRGVAPDSYEEVLKEARNRGVIPNPQRMKTRR